MKSFLAILTLASAVSVLANPLPEPVDRRAPANPYGKYSKYGKYGKYGNYGAYSRSAEAEADIEALLDLASMIKEKREAEV